MQTPEQIWQHLCGEGESLPPAQLSRVVRASALPPPIKALLLQQMEAAGTITRGVFLEVMAFSGREMREAIRKVVVPSQGTPAGLV
jgi:hypothetical protein